MKERAAIAEFATMLVVAVLGVGAGAAALLVPAAPLAAIFATLRGRDEKRILAKAVEASVTALSNGSEFSADDIITAQGWIATQDLSFTLHPAKIAAARGDVAKVLDAALADATIPPDGTTRTILRCALRAAYDCCRSFDDFHQRFTQDMLVQIAQDHGVALQKINQILELVEKLAHSDKAKDALVDALHRAEREFQSTQTMLASFLRIILEQDVPPEQFGAALMGLAASWKEAGARINALDRSRNLNPKLDPLREQAKAAYDAEDQESVWRILSEIDRIEEANLQDLDAHIKEAVAERAQRLEARRETKQSKLAVAKSTANAERTAEMLVDLLKLDQPADLFGALRGLMREWHIRNRDFGLPFDGHVAIALARATLAHAKGSHQRGAAQNDLGIALRILGAHSGDGARLEQAVDAYRAALQVYTQADTPLDWAMTQNNLGIALATLGERSGDGTLLEQAVDAYRAALQVRTQAETPVAWATTQNNLGAALQALGERSGDGALLERAVDAYRAALLVRTQAETPLDWAMTQNNLGIALQALGARSGDGALLQQAVDAYRAALQVYTQADTPLYWAGTQNNLGNALGDLGEQSGDGALLQQAVGAFRAALQVHTQAETPVVWANTTGNLAILDLSFHDLDPDPRHLASARERALAARAVYERIGAEYDLGMVDHILSDIAARSAA